MATNYYQLLVFFIDNNMLCNEFKFVIYDKQDFTMCKRTKVRSELSLKLRTCNIQHINRLILSHSHIFLVLQGGVKASRVSMTAYVLLTLMELNDFPELQVKYTIITSHIIDKMCMN